MSALYCLFSFRHMENVEFKLILNIADTNFEDFLLHFQVIEENRKQPFESNVRICLLKYFFEPRSYNACVEKIIIIGITIIVFLA